MPAELNSRHENNFSVGFELAPARPGLRSNSPSKISSNLGHEKIFRNTRSTAELLLREAALVFSTVTLALNGRKPSQRTGCGLVTGAGATVGWRRE
jgi:hypothetical protein